MIRFTALFLCWFSLSLVASEPLHKTQQLIVVTSSSWNADKATLCRYEKKGTRWQKIGRCFPVFLGRNGMGWGIGLHRTPRHARYRKQEGDGRSPAGIFLLKQGFGYEPESFKYPFRPYGKDDICVDDPASRYYNRIVNQKKVIRDYRSFEHMRLQQDFYRYGIAVNHNHFDENGSVKSAGSCIFLHIKNRPTAGCTAMDRKQIVTILKWLDPDKSPLLVQAPKSHIRHLLQAVGFKDE